MVGPRTGRPRCTAVLVAIASILTACAGTPESHSSTGIHAPEISSQDAVSINNLIDAAVSENGLKGLSFAIASENAPLMSGARGWASRKERRPFHPETPTMVASVTKLFTAVAVMQLVETGALELDAPITTYLPELEDRNLALPGLAEPQLRHLLFHHSGLQSDLFDEVSFRTDAPDDWSVRFRTLTDRADDISQAQDPGTVISYSNLSYSLLAIVIERVSMVPFHDYMRSEVLDPLGMADATLAPDSTLIGTMAFGIDGRSETAFIRTRDVAAGGLVTSAEELVHFGQMVLGRGLYKGSRVVGRHELEMMLAVQNGDSELDADQTIGYGFWLDDSGVVPAGTRVAHHGGDETPYHAFLLVLPDNDLTVVITTNSPFDSMRLAVLAEEIAVVLMDTDASESTADHRQQGELPNGIPVDGLYTLPFGYAHIERLSDTRARMRTGLFTARLDRQQEGDWHARYLLFGFIPIRIADIADMSFRFGEFDGMPMGWMYIQGVNVGPMAPVMPTTFDDLWRGRVGKYEVVDADSNTEYKTIVATWDTTHETLLVGPSIGFGFEMTYPTAPLSDDLVRVQGYGRNLGETIEWLDENTLKFSGSVYSRT